MPTKHQVRLVPRDHAILGELAAVGVLSVEQIHHRHFPDDVTGKSCLRRLRYFEGARLVVAVPVTACFGSRAKRQTIYRLTSVGADVVAQRTGTAARYLRTDPKAETLLHRLSVAHVILTMNDGAAAAGLPKPLWLLEHDRWPEAPRDVPEPRQYRLADDFLPIVINPSRPAEQYGPPVYDDPTVRLVKVRPDAAALLSVEPGTAPLALSAEVDLGTETLGQFISKFSGYHALLTKHAYRRPWAGLTDSTAMIPRVLLVFSSAERRDHVMDRLSSDPTVVWARTAQFKSSPDDRERARAFLDQFFRFAVLTDFDATDLLTRPVWQTLSRRSRPQQIAIVARETMA
jgi:hypothetical protein